MLRYRFGVSELTSLARDESRAVVFHGPPGIGKTHAWAAAVESARSDGFRVLAARPSEAEVRLVGSALVDLFHDVTDDELRRLPALQYAALAEALRRTTGEARADPTAVAAAFAAAVTLLAAESPVALAVDDIQWLDRETADLLSFAARRLPGRGVVLLLTLRDEPGVPDPGLLTAAASALPLQREPVAPLGEAQLVEVVRQRTGVELAGEDRRRVLDLSQGNPLFAIELVRHMGAGSGARLPGSLRAVTGAALDGLPARTLAALAAAAALAAPTLAQLSTLGLAADLGPAEHAGLIAVSDRRIRFVHPLYAAAAYDRLPAAERVTLHRDLAGVVEDPEERARHLALAAQEPDADLALELDEVADQARRRGAPWAALDAVRLAISLSPHGDELVFGRRLRLAQTLRQVGETELARDELSRLVDSEAGADLRAAAYGELALALLPTEGADVATTAIDQGLALASAPSVRADLHLAAALHCELFSERVAWHCEQALAALEQLPEPDPVRTHRARLRRLEADWVGARSEPDLAATATLPEGVTLLPEQLLELAVVRFDWQIGTDRSTEARETLGEVLELADLVGDDSQAVHAILQVANLEESAGDLTLAYALLDDAETRAVRSQLDDYALVVRRTRRRFDVVRGRHEPDEGDASSNWGALVDASTRGLRAYLAGDHAGTVDALEPMLANYERWGIHHPRLLPRGAELFIEALIRLERVGEAEQVLLAREERTRRTASRSAQASNARCRAVLYAERGREDAAMASADLAVEIAGSLGNDFDRARALLTRGQVARRFKRRGEARRSLEQAAATFERMGAGAFARRARDELTRVAGRAHASGLTSTEERIAELTARGLTTRETAAELFLSPKTVSNQLTTVYRKLGVRSRSELAARLAAAPAVETPAVETPAAETPAAETPEGP